METSFVFVPRALKLSIQFPLLLGGEPFLMTRAADYLVMLAEDSIPRSPPLPIDRPLVLDLKGWVNHVNRPSPFARLVLAPGPSVGPGMAVPQPGRNLEPDP